MSRFPRYPTLIRTCIFRPYIKREDLPAFTLQLFDMYLSQSAGSDNNGIERHKFRLAYKLHMRIGKKSVALFDGADFFTPNSIDGDKTVRGIMFWLTLRPGDTDQEYFEKYSEEALAYCSDHAEALDVCVQDRFSED
jgi:hypothetical protein